MANPRYVKLSFLPHTINKLVDFGMQHMWKTARNTYKHSTIAMNIVQFMLDLRNNTVFNAIVQKEGILPLSLILRELNRYAVRQGYGVIEIKQK